MNCVLHGEDRPQIIEPTRPLLTVLDAVYVDVRDAKGLLSIRPKAAFEAVLGVTLTAALSR